MHAILFSVPQVKKNNLINYSISNKYNFYNNLTHTFYINIKFYCYAKKKKYQKNKTLLISIKLFIVLKLQRLELTLFADVFREIINNLIIRPSQGRL
jgi:hypothetical protein